MNRIDPRTIYLPKYKLIKEYPGMQGKLGLEISKDGYTKTGVIPIANDAKDFPEFWHDMDNKHDSHRSGDGHYPGLPFTP